YAGQSAAAAAVAPFAEPPVTGTGASSGGHEQLSQLVAAIPQALHGLSASVASAASAGSMTAAVSAPVPALSLAQVASYIELLPKSIVPFNVAIKTILYGMVQYSRNLNTDLDIAAATGGRAGFGSGVAALAAAESVGLGGSAPAMSASVGSAGTVGKLTVPQGWAAVAPEVTMTAIPGTTLAAAPAATVAAAVIPTGIFSDMALASLVGRTISGSAPRASPAAIMNGHAQTRLERLVTELAGTHDVQHWHVDPSRLDSLLEELAEQPGVHAVHVNPDGQNTIPPRPQPG
ncbi:MAG: hypothetical protein ABI307_11545, partial [Mycobacterium sp.]